MVLPGGDAVTVVPVDADKLVVGVHVYVAPPEAVKVAPTPGQAAPLFTVTGILPPTVTVAGAVALQPVKVPEAPSMDVTVYVVVTVGLASVLGPVVTLNLVDGVHVYVGVKVLVVVVVAVKVADEAPPGHIAPGVAVTVNG